MLCRLLAELPLPPRRPLQDAALLGLLFFAFLSPASASKIIGASPPVALLDSENRATFAVLNFGDEPLFAELTTEEKRASLSPRFVEIPPRQKAWAAVSVGGDEAADFLVLVKPKSINRGFAIVPAVSVRIRSTGRGVAVRGSQNPEPAVNGRSAEVGAAKRTIAKSVESRLSPGAASLLALSVIALTGGILSRKGKKRKANLFGEWLK